jgi:hypothetical protein
VSGRRRTLAGAAVARAPARGGGRIPRCASFAMRQTEDARRARGMKLQCSPCAPSKLSEGIQMVLQRGPLGRGRHARVPAARDAAARDSQSSCRRCRRRGHAAPQRAHKATAASVRALAQRACALAALSRAAALRFVGLAVASVPAFFGQQVTNERTNERQKAKAHQNPPKSTATLAPGWHQNFRHHNIVDWPFPVAHSRLRVRGGGRRAPARSHKAQACWQAAQRHANAQ